MARNQEVVTITGDDYVELTNGPSTKITIQVQQGEVSLRFTTDGTPPASGEPGLRVKFDYGPIQRSIAELTALAGADRVWAKNGGPEAKVFVDAD